MHSLSRAYLPPGPYLPLSYTCLTIVNFLHRFVLPSCFPQPSSRSVLHQPCSSSSSSTGRKAIPAMLTKCHRIPDQLQPYGEHRYGSARGFPILTHTAGGKIRAINIDTFIWICSKINSNLFGTSSYWLGFDLSAFLCELACVCVWEHVGQLGNSELEVQTVCRMPVIRSRVAENRFS